MVAEEIEKPWVEKYRPQSLKEIVSQTLTIESLIQFASIKRLPHLIFTGPAGTGKTSTAVALINDILGKANVRQDVLLEKNASDEVRMDDLGDIKNFVFHTGIQQNNSFKFIILDESDNIPNEVQSAFRRIIEMAPSNVKFIFLCNYVERIIDPILSRCAIFRFYPLPQPEFEKQIKFIASKEKIRINSEILNAIYYISQGDMRQAINLFQMIVSLLEDTTKDRAKIKLDPNIIYEISGFLPPEILNNLFKAMELKQFTNITNFLRVPRGISSRGILRQLMNKIIEKYSRSPLLERLLIVISQYDYRLTLEANPSIQMDGLFAELISIIDGR